MHGRPSTPAQQQCVSLQVRDTKFGISVSRGHQSTKGETCLAILQRRHEQRPSSRHYGIWWTNHDCSTPIWEGFAFPLALSKIACCPRPCTLSGSCIHDSACVGLNMRVGYTTLAIEALDSSHSPTLISLLSLTGRNGLTQGPFRMWRLYPLA